MKNLIRSLALCLALQPAIAAAQVPNTPQTLPANTVVGRLGVTAGPAQAIPFSRFQAAVSGPCATASAGLVPATGGGTSNFLRADCTFANPTPPIANNSLLVNTSGVSAVASGATPTGFWDAFCSTTIGNFWVRQSGGWGCTALGYANPVWWGADPTGVADSAAAFNSAIATNLPIQWPNGKFRINSAITVTLPNAVACFCMAGMGNSTILYWPNANGGITVTATSFRNNFQIRDLAISTALAGGGNGLKFIGVGTGNSRPSNITNVMVYGDDLNGVTASTNYWSVSVWIHAWSVIDIRNLNTWGAFNPTPGGPGGGTGLLIEGDTPTTQYATIINVFGSSFNAHSNGTQLGGYWQGLTFNQCNWNGALGSNGLIQTGSAGGTLVLLNITNSQFNYAGTQISLNSPVLVLQLFGNGISVYGNNGVGVSVGSGAVYSQISGNFFDIFGTPTGTFGIVTSGATGIIEGNVFNRVTTGINLQAASSNLTVGLNAFAASVTTKVTNSSTGNSVGTAVAGNMAGVVP